MSEKRRTVGLSGAPSRSMSLGANDPRTRRGAQSALSQQTRLGDGLRIDERQRLGVAPAGSPGDLDGEADLDATIGYIQSLVEKLRAAGLME